MRTTKGNYKVSEMGTKIIVELFVCDKSLAVIQKYQLNPAEIAIEAILETIKTKQQIENHLTGCNLVLENKALKGLVADSLQEIERLKSVQRVSYLNTRRPITNPVIRI